MLRWTWGGDGREVGTGKAWRLGEASWPAGDLWAELTGRETPGLVKWRRGKMNLEASCTDQLSRVKWLHRNWGEEGRSLDWTNLLGGMIEAILENTSKSTSVYSMPPSSLLSRVEWGPRGKKIQLYMGESNYEPYHLRIPKFSSSNFFPVAIPQSFSRQNHSAADSIFQRWPQ